MAKTYDLSAISALVIDDNHHMISIIKTLLRGFGVKQITEATDAMTAFEVFRNARSDIIFLDYMMPTFDGIEFTQLVRTASDSPNPEVPIIMVTAYSERANIEAARDAGITELLTKPVSAIDVYRRVIQVIEKPRPFIRSARYIGPCRRRTPEPNPNYTGRERRKSAGQQTDAPDDTPEQETETPEQEAGAA